MLKAAVGVEGTLLESHTWLPAERSRQVYVVLTYIAKPTTEAIVRF